MHSSLELGNVYLEELATFSSFGDKTIFPFNVYANYRVSAVTACHALRSCAWLQGYIGYHFFDQV